MFQNNTECSSYTLQLEQYTSKTIINQTLQADWMIDIEATFTKIVIDNCYFEEIEDGAFDHSAFSQVTELKLNNLPLKRFSQNMFEGLTAVNVLYIAYIDFEAELGCFHPFVAVLKESLLFENMRNIEALRNLLGDPENPLATEIVSLSYNDFSEELYPNSFTGLSNVKSLFLKSCKITSLPETIFHSIFKTLELLDLSDNQLVSFSTELFTGVQPTIKIDLSNNSFICDCRLQFFIELLRLTNIFNLFPPVCSAPDELAGQTIQSIILDCTSTTTETSLIPEEMTDSTVSPETLPTSSTEDTSEDELGNGTPTTEIPSTPSQLTTIRLECVNYGQKQINVDDSDFELKTRTADFKILENDYQQVYVEFTSLCDGSALIWFHNSSAFNSEQLELEAGIDYDCVNNFSSMIIVSNLIYNKNYIFCLIQRNKLEVSPFDCIAYTLENREEVWIYLSEKNSIIAIFIVVLCGSIFIGGILMYLCLKLIPYIYMKRSLRKESQVSEYEDIDYSSTTNNNYISPTLPRHSIYSRQR